MAINIAKRAAALSAVSYVKDGMIVGLGTGSTAYYAIEELAKQLPKGLEFKGVPTSEDTRSIAQKLGIPLLENFTEIDVTIDGADEVDEHGNLIKGGGGALTREKIVASVSTQEIIIVDPSKMVKKLGKFPLPVEVIPFGWQAVAKRLERKGGQVELRKKDERIFLTDNGHYILDCELDEIEAPQELAAEINLIPGVVENGLFVGLTDLVVIGYPDGKVDEVTIRK